MIVYEATKGEFVDHVFNGQLIEEIRAAFERNVGYCPSSEIPSWNSSLTYMRMVVDTPNISDECGVAIEFMVPLTQKRIDFIITGRDSVNSDAAVIVELKQWQSIEAVDNRQSIVKTYTGGGLREVAHPSYQAWSYARMIQDFNEEVSSGNVRLYPCAYLHNYILREEDPLIDDRYAEEVLAAPPFCASDADKLRSFIERYVSKGDQKEVLYRIDKGRIRPAKSLQDSLKSMVEGNQEFVLIDEQKVAFETIKDTVESTKAVSKKNVLIVEGGPGTGKSVIAINLLVDIINDGLVASYVSKNSAPRDVYKALLAKGHTKKKLDTLFRGSGQFMNPILDAYDVLLVDEAHRLNQKSGLYGNQGDNQIREVIQSAKTTVFFIDESQRVHVSDIGTRESITSIAHGEGANVSMLRLDSQFRCNGSDGYITWLRNLLGISNEPSIDGANFLYDFHVFDSPNELHEAIVEKNKLSGKARVVAGYCWNWPKDSKDDPDSLDIQIPEHNYAKSWNLASGDHWAIAEDSVDQIGCIHTSQGLEFDYVGVIVGPDMKFVDGQIVTDYTKHPGQDAALKGLRSRPKDEAELIADTLIRNTYNVLMTRGQKGCYIYCCDEALGRYIKSKLAAGPISYGAFKTEDYLIAAEEGCEN